MHLNNTDHIIRTADRLLHRTGSRDPEIIAEELNIRIYGVPFQKQKGVYKILKRNRCIFVKEDLEEPMRQIVLLHEIGHDQLHRRQASLFQEFNLFDMNRNIMEYEANLFAAQIMLPDEEVIDYIYQGYSVCQIAGVMNSDINLVALKAADLSRRGYSFRILEHNNTFLQ
ncbi:ImmA/IrrE family metallo-endopeptidase [Lachnoclostridium sp. Marseille-P6806]|uniref:ImmA/IrrE family metallo-endopeptidase n=1 Tax=Lachnoclostridium sp. Marseille-P6806 TaxID=2364793 RepID=UPI00102F8EA4|nr:ImmA/IrrE family metallo-endopeptidase [Lachnoclostridium sp. Marseille-P6806]